MAREQELSITPGRRFETGLIATLVRGNETETRHFLGVRGGATRACAAYCDAHGWKILTLSTPATIFRDLQGDRHYQPESAKGNTSSYSANPMEVWFPERSLLGPIGRTDLWVGKP